MQISPLLTALAALALTASALPTPTPASAPQSSKFAALHCDFAAILLGTAGLCSPAWITQETLCCGRAPLCPSSGTAFTQFPSGQIPASLSSLWPLPRRIMTGTALPPSFTPGPPATTPPAAAPTGDLYDPLASGAASRASEIAAAGGLDAFMAAPTAAPKKACEALDTLVNTGRDCGNEWWDAVVACKGREAAERERAFECAPVADLPGVGVGRGLPTVTLGTPVPVKTGY
ncbi:hypothetical protein EDC01DRAFT_645567 [Geopyxis carbonaria]|nr:hypothetical protein EDC01DRAFT_645567 [Geopyxis carbonaria]